MLERSNLQSLSGEWSSFHRLELTDLEKDLIKLYRQMSESEQKQIRRIAGYLAKPVEIE
ncbi:hypothetical protein LT702_24460 [Pseudomonas syringae pv. syringae]|uniref:hypothetical protein n=1 Tax=Pseudomonas syringae TaxID=317 RepID=UPI00200A5673|nr:hypothetical protein [Pseudomonas syringae]MCK9754741.1 hypothetical protein [Pseudomonas syringae pv. syringae]